MQKITGPRMNHLKVQDSGTHMEKYVSDGRMGGGKRRKERLGREGGERGRKKKGIEGEGRRGRGEKEGGERGKEGGGEGEGRRGRGRMEEGRGRKKIDRYFIRIVHLTLL